MDPEKSILDFARIKGDARIKEHSLSDLPKDIQEWGRCSNEMAQHVKTLDDMTFLQIRDNILTCLDPVKF